MFFYPIVPRSPLACVGVGRSLWCFYHNFFPTSWDSFVLLRFFFFLRVFATVPFCFCYFAQFFSFVCVFPHTGIPFFFFGWWGGVLADAFAFLLMVLFKPRSFLVIATGVGRRPLSDARRRGRGGNCPPGSTVVRAESRTVHRFRFPKWGKGWVADPVCLSCVGHCAGGDRVRDLSRQVGSFLTSSLRCSRHAFRDVLQLQACLGRGFLTFGGVAGWQCHIAYHLERAYAVVDPIFGDGLAL